jgi:TatD DNase family protein
VRINTNGHGNLINKKNILPELEGLVDNISVSLNAQDEDTYDRICKPTFVNAFQEVISFIRKARTYVPEVSITVVTHKGVDIEKCRKIANDLGVQFRVRNLDLVG